MTQTGIAFRADQVKPGSTDSGRCVGYEELCGINKSVYVTPEYNVIADGTVPLPSQVSIFVKIHQFIGRSIYEKRAHVFKPDQLRIHGLVWKHAKPWRIK